MVWEAQEALEVLHLLFLKQTLGAGCLQIVKDSRLGLWVYPEHQVMPCDSLTIYDLNYKQEQEHEELAEILSKYKFAID